MKTIDIQQNTPEWEQLRKTKVGASDANIIMGLSSFATPYQLWQQKLDLVPRREMTSSMQRGHFLETIAREKCEEALGLLLMPLVAIHEKHEWMMASFDGIDPEGKQIVEIKCPNKRDHEMAINFVVPEKYYAQLQHQIEIAQVEMANYFSFDGNAGVFVKVYRDDKFIKEMITKERAFLECVQEFIPPEYTNRDYIEMTEPEWICTAERWKALMEKESLLTEEKEILKMELIRIANDRNVMGNGLKVSKVSRKGPVDYSKIPELQNKDLNSYRKPIIDSWRISMR